MLGEVINSDAPAIHDDATETTARPDLWRVHAPLVHRPGKEFDIMHQLEMLPEVIFPIERPLFLRPFHATGIVMRLDMSVVGIR